MEHKNENSRSCKVRIRQDRRRRIREDDSNKKASSSTVEHRVPKFFPEKNDRDISLDFPSLFQG
jgi:hypothetical protein